MFGKYYIVRKNGNIEEININSEEEVMASLQNENPSECDFVAGIEQKDDNVFLTENKYEAYSKIKSYINETIETNI